jgi:nucleoside-diphosphate-sugar epimerase
LGEDAQLRRRLSLGGEDYDKIGVEEILASTESLPVTILRYPAIYGPGDRQYRFHYFAKRMSDGRGTILLRETESHWRWTHAYAEDAAFATYVAVTKDPPSRIYNVGEALVPTVNERVEQIALVMGWQGRILVVSDDAMPESLLPESRLRNLPNFQRPPDYRQQYALDSGLIRRELGYHEVVSFEEGLRRTISWQLEQAVPIDPQLVDYSREDELIAALGG